MRDQGKPHQICVAQQASPPSCLSTNGHVDLRGLSVPPPIKYLIQHGDTIGQYPSRSEALSAVLMALLDAGYSDPDISRLCLLEEHGISELPREKGPAWLAQELKRARRKANSLTRQAKGEPEDADDLMSDTISAPASHRRGPAQRRDAPVRRQEQARQVLAHARPCPVRRHRQPGLGTLRGAGAATRALHGPGGQQAAHPAATARHPARRPDQRHAAPALQLPPAQRRRPGEIAGLHRKPPLPSHHHRRAGKDRAQRPGTATTRPTTTSTACSRRSRTCTASIPSAWR